MPAALALPLEALAALCRRHPVRRRALFGSAPTSQFGPDSDVDLLVEFELGLTPGLGFVRLPVLAWHGQRCAARRRWLPC